MDTEVLDSAVYTSKDGFRLAATYTVTPENGDPYVSVRDLRRDRHGALMATIEAAVTVAPFVRPKVPPAELYDEITSEFWNRVANHFGVSVDRARTHMLITGNVPVAVGNLWGKATLMMDGPDVNTDDIKDDGNW